MNTETTQDSKSRLRNGLAMQTGSQCCFRHWAGTMRFTEGLKFLADEAGAYWLIDNIAAFRLDAKVRSQDFVLWKLRVNADESAVLIAEDGNENEILRQHIPWTNFPLEEISLYLTDDMLLLPSEY